MAYDNSQLQTYKDCSERYRLRYIEGLKKIEEDHDEHDRNFGKAIHAGLEAYYKKEGLNKAKEAFSREYPVQLSQDDLAKTEANGLLLLEAYAKHYQEEDKSLEILSIEVKDSFCLSSPSLTSPDREAHKVRFAPLRSSSIDFLVKIDMVVRKQGCIYWVDHKTTGKTFNWSYWSRFEPNSQVTAYTAYCQAKYGECSGGIINAIRFGHRQRAYKGEAAGFYYEFQRQLFNRNSEQIKAWKQDTLRWIESLETAKAGGAEVWKKNEGQCGYCSYKPICISCADPQIIEQLYEKTNPLEYLGETT
jgi:hypothetical protein